MRSILTMLGIIIGVAAVIAMVAWDRAPSTQVAEQIASMGTNMLIVQAGSQNTGGVRGGAGTTTTLTPDDVQAILREAPAVAGRQPRVSTAGVTLVVWQPELDDARRRSGEQDFPEIRNRAVASGAFFTDADVTTAARVAVIGQTVAEPALSGMDPVGQMMRVRNLPFRVVGVLAAKGQSPWGQDQDDTMVYPTPPR